MSFYFKICSMGTCFKNPKIIVLYLHFFFIYSYFHLCHANDTIIQGQLINDGETIISSGQTFELGFFSPKNTTYRYVGIWYHGVPEQTIIWVANRENPIFGNSGALTLNENGHLIVMDGDKNFLWSSSNSSTSENATAVLKDDGDLVITSSISNTDLWDSFNHSTDTFLPKMEVHMTVGDYAKQIFNSWKNENDPSIGEFLMGIDARVSPQIVFWNGTKRHWRSGLWDGEIFIGMPYMSSQYLYGFKVTYEGIGKYYIGYTSPNESDLVRFRIRWDGIGEQLRWNLSEKRWDTLQIEPHNNCEVYNFCGTFGICSDVTGSIVCGCPKGFKPRDSDQWDKGNWTEGCVRKTELICMENETSTVVGDTDGFLKIEGVKWPDFADLAAVGDEENCEAECLKNCSCNAYLFSKSIGCIVWHDDLVDMHHYKEGGGDLYVRVAKSDLGTGNKTYEIVIIVSVVVALLLIGLCIFLLWRFRKNSQVTSLWRKRNQAPVSDAMRSQEYSIDFSGNELIGVERQAGRELSLLSFSDIVAATDNFSDRNKLGKGGFGPVYKGNLLGEEIAVKRLAKKSGQGLEEFKNEVILIAKLQHINLVRILGCCIEGDERMLVYEYMPNKSLDSFIFDSTKQAQLNWQRRFTIIEGIARGLVYLHRDSRLRIIHRDLKASNILLDDEMSPKISDFGMSKIFGKNVKEASTSRVVGTFGYMAPEYAMEGLFSVKSDVYSFGVLLLEIISGQRNASFHSSERSNIIGHAWDLWYAGKAMELVDPSIVDTCCEDQVLRCIHIAMLCVQDSPDHRPTMSSVVLMLESENVTLPKPREPTYTSMRRSGDIGISKDSSGVVSSNNITITRIIGR